MRNVAPEFDFVEEVEAIWSVGSASHEWLCKTFTNDHRETIAKTVYVSTNPHVPTTFQYGERPPETYTIPLMYADWNVVSADDFQLLRHIHDHDYEDYYATIPADLVTDHAIQVGRSHDFDRMIVHYFQPHRPYIGRAPGGERHLTDTEDDPWNAIRTGTSSVEVVRELYEDNLRYVLRSVGRLLENVDADTVAITADHGDLIGEFGLYGHPEGLVHPNLKRVPWVKTTARDTKSSDPVVDVSRQQADVDPMQRLRDLGYL